MRQVVIPTGFPDLQLSFQPIVVFLHIACDTKAEFNLILKRYGKSYFKKRS
jgi:hypothetical protein